MGLAMTAVTSLMRDLRHFTVAEIRQQGYDVAYCKLCGCNKSGDVHQPNVLTEACTSPLHRDPGCLCHVEVG